MLILPDATELQNDFTEYENTIIELIEETNSNLTNLNTLTMENKEYLVKIEDGLSYLVEQAEIQATEEVADTVLTDVESVEYLDYINSGVVVLIVLAAAILGALVFRIFSAKAV